MSVHYKFKSTLDYDTITFDGLHISVGDLKRAIVERKKFGKFIDFDLKVINAQTNEEYVENAFLIPKNTSLIISRVPLNKHQKKTWEPQIDDISQTHNISNKVDGVAVDITQMKGSEEDKIQAMMLQSTADYDPKSYQKLRGHSQSGEVPLTYRCNKCKQGGHWIKNCPMTVSRDHVERKRNTGIPKSLRDKDDMLQQETTETTPEKPQEQTIPDDLVCSICNDLFVDAVMIPCCGSSFCDDCVRSALLDSDDNECPDCKEKGTSPESLIPNRFLRNSVNSFKNETGYKKAFIKKVLPTPAEKLTKQCDKPTESAVSPVQHNDQETQPINTTSINNDSPLKTTSESVEPKPANPLQSDEIESDFEDNIVIKMPPTAEPQPLASTEKPLESEISNNHTTTTEVENTHFATKQPQSSVPLVISENNHNTQEKHSDWYRNEYEGNTRRYEQRPMQPANVEPHDLREHQPKAVNTHNTFGPPGPRMNNYHVMPMHHPVQQNVPHSGRMPYGYSYHSGPRPVLGYPNFGPNTVNSNHNTYMPRGHVHNRHEERTPTNLASVYQGVAAKLGTGIIDDPLEAFNRIMKEKEKRKVERYRRSRSIDRKRNNFRSPTFEHRGNRDVPIMKHERSREEPRQKRVHDPNYRFQRKLSTSYSDWSSRSRSRSKSPNRRSRLKRSRSRTRNINERHRPKDHDRPLPKKEKLRHESSEEKRLLERPSPSTHQRQSGPKFISDEPPPPGFEPTLPDNCNLQNNYKESIPHIRSTTPDLYSSTKKIYQADKSKIKRNEHHHHHRNSPSRSSDTNPIKSSKESKKLDHSNVSEREKNKKSNSYNNNKEKYSSPVSEKPKKEYAITPVQKVETTDKILKKSEEREIEAKHKRDKSKDRKKKLKDKKERKKSKKEKEKKSKRKRDDNESDHSKVQNTSEKNTTIRNPFKSPPKSSDQMSNINTAENLTKSAHHSGKSPYLDCFLDVPYETDFECSNSQNQVLEIAPSKWEREDMNTDVYEDTVKLNDSRNRDLVSDDIIRKAENALFTGATNNARLSELKNENEKRTRSKSNGYEKNTIESKSKFPSVVKSIHSKLEPRLGSAIVNKAESKYYRSHTSKDNYDYKFNEQNIKRTIKNKDYEKNSRGSEYKAPEDSRRNSAKMFSNVQKSFGSWLDVDEDIKKSTQDKDCKFIDFTVDVKYSKNNDSSYDYKKHPTERHSAEKYTKSHTASNSSLNDKKLDISSNSELDNTVDKKKKNKHKKTKKRSKRSSSVNSSASERKKTLKKKKNKIEKKKKKEKK